jgi:EmrB/QacA subfamily drug resistance transporter
LAKPKTQNPESREPDAGRKWRTLAVVGAGTFMSALDGSVVNTALPIIGRETRAALPTLEWIVLIYLLTATSTLLIFGRLADIYGRKRFYVTGLALFAVGSLASGLAPSIRALIAFRAVQALGAAMLFALGPAVLTAAFPKAERGRALGMQATLTYLGLSAGPALGGLLTQYLGWRSIFYINVPIGLLVFSIALSAIQADTDRRRQPFDFGGAALLAAFLTSLLFALSEGAAMGWRNPVILASVLAAPASLAAFVAAERRNAHPALDLSLFSNLKFAAAVVAAFLCYAASSAVTLLMPFYLIQACGYRVDAAGLLLISSSAVMAALASPAGWISDQIGQRRPAVLGMIVLVAGVLWLRRLTPDETPTVIVWRLALIGAGMGLFTSPNNSELMGSAPPERQGVAGALLAAARNLGFGVGVAAAGTIYMIRLHGLAGAMPTAQAVTVAMRDATTAIGSLVVPGIFLRVRVR